MSQVISDVFPFIIDEYSFDRMRDMNEDLDFSNYKKFLEHNIQCINELPDDDKMWLHTLCKKLKSKMINLVDNEHCVEFGADSFYFNKNKKLCISNPR